MAPRNPNLAKLRAGYLFPEINRRKAEFLKENPDAQLISLGIGDTTEPLTPCISAAMSEAAQSLGTREGYSGYGESLGDPALREAIASVAYGGAVDAEDVIISDGSKCDIGRLLVLLGPEATFAVQDPSYPAYVDSGVITGLTGEMDDATSQFREVAYLPCTPENDFFPDLSTAPRTDVIFFCSPNNPTGAVANREQLTELVAFAKANRSIIVYDSAYAAFIQDEAIPRTIFEIPGAREVAIETTSLSKSAGFTGVRLGWTIVPQELKFDDGSSVHADWSRLVSTMFNGASNLVQRGALAAFSEEGRRETADLVTHYMRNVQTLALVADQAGVEHYGGKNAPYLWLRMPGKTSWDSFAEILAGAHVVCTPGSGFGPAGEGFVRLSAFGGAEQIVTAAERLRKLWS